MYAGYRNKIVLVLVVRYRDIYKMMEFSIRRGGARGASRLRARRQPCTGAVSPARVALFRIGDRGYVWDDGL